MKKERLARAPISVFAAALVIGAGVVATAYAQQAHVAKPGSSSAGQPAAVVNGEKISRQEVATDMLADQMAAIRATRPQFANRRLVAGSVGALVLNKLSASGGQPVTITRQEVIDWLFTDKNASGVVQTVQSVITERLLRQTAKAQGVTASPAEVNRRYSESLNQAREQLRLQGMTDAQVVGTVGVRPDYIKRNVANQIMAEKLVQKDLEKKLGHPVGPSDFLEASHILVRVIQQDPTKKEQDYATALQKIKGYAEDIKAGKISFEDAALKYSDDPSKFQKGSLGIFMRGQMVGPFEKAAFSLEPGKVSDPVRSEFGWHLIRVSRLGKDTTGPERAKVVDQYVKNNLQGLMAKLAKDNEKKIVNNVQAPKTQPEMGIGGPRGQ